MPPLRNGTSTLTLTLTSLVGGGPEPPPPELTTGPPGVLGDPPHAQSAAASKTAAIRCNAALHGYCSVENVGGRNVGLAVGCRGSAAADRGSSDRTIRTPGSWSRRHRFGSCPWDRSSPSACPIASADRDYRPAPAIASRRDWRPVCRSCRWCATARRCRCRCRPVRARSTIASVAPCGNVNVHRAAAVAIGAEAGVPNAGSGLSEVSCAPAARMPGGGVGDPLGFGLGVGFCGVS